MRKTANSVVVLSVIVCAVFVCAAQNPPAIAAAQTNKEKLPPFLQPSEYAIDRAKEMGGEVFKLFSIYWGYDRGSSFGTYYSFKDQKYASKRATFPSPVV